MLSEVAVLTVVVVAVVDLPLVVVLACTWM